MAQSAPPPGTTRPPERNNAWAAGGTMFAGVLLLVDGVLDIFKGIAGIASDEVYARISDYTFRFDVTTWGWIHLILGVILVLVGLGILRGAAWARGFGVAIAALNLIANFVWLPYQPVWAIVSIAIDTFVIWALCTDRSKPVL
ncbi:hypothetical protein [Streptomyces nitrosporeus]|uniref:DUF7144 domain-containing protein n=1 Tax=Streptomyces nitrosporeus TaxID=28894 RepID=A0A5J6FE51_9ACTN|nr:hypothetical protein [Streptomyces nitrosporeus]QEU74678.1 hypothetical protein CP967_24210 [Streptomyces nitrosporeus]GGY85042.1 hypothetical protein GCM10010327_14350 [Streptomyces nitrosporeus]